LIGISFMLGSGGPLVREQLGAYECGFMPFNEARIQLTVRYYMLALFFILFDLEIILLFPWAVILSQYVGRGCFGVMAVFIFCVGLGLVYEWITGSLGWLADTQRRLKRIKE